MIKIKKKIPRIFIYIPIIICILTAIVFIVRTAYFAKGEFKDVFINKKDYFAADVLYGVSSIEAAEAEKRVVGSSGANRQINIYNHDVSTGDFNSFDVEFDVYAWLSAELPEGKSYVLSYGSYSITFTDQTNYAKPVFENLELKGGKRSTVTLTAEFGFNDGDDLATAPGLYVVAVPTSPERLNKAYIGALIRPTRSEAFNFEGGFDDVGKVEDYAAFTYRVNTVGIAPEGNKIRIKWNSNVFTLIRVNGEDANTVTVVSDDYGNGLDSMIEWDAKSDWMDYFVFFRNTETETGNSVWNNDPTWDQLRGYVTAELFVSDTQE